MKQSFTLFFIVLISLSSIAQKRAMTVEDSKTWNKISNRSISSDGNYVSYRISPHKGDGNLFLYNDIDKTTQSFERGKNAKLGFKNDLLIFKIAPQADSLRLKKLKKVKKNKLPKDSLGIYLFKKDSLIKVEKIKNYFLPEKNSKWLAYLYDFKAPKDSLESKKDSIQSPSDTLNVKKDSLKTEKKKFKQEGKRLVILNTNTLENYIYDNIAEVHYSRNAKNFAFIQQIKDSIDTAKVYLFDVQAAKELLIFEKAGQAKKVKLDEKGSQLSFIFTSDTTDAKKQTLWHCNTKQKDATLLLDTISSFPLNWGISENRAPYFSKSGQRLYFGLAKFPIEEPEDTLLDDEKVRIDIWSWTDKRLQPHQLKNKKDDLEKSFLCYYDFSTKKFIQLEDSLIETRGKRDIEPDYYLGTVSEPYLRMMSWDVEFPKDYYIIDAKTGHKRLLSKEKKWRTYISPKGKHTLIWDKTNEEWLIANNKTLKISELSSKADDVFFAKNHDMPTLKSHSGIIGWSEGENFVFINSQYDIWKFDAQSTKTAVNLTKGEGLKHKIEYDYQQLDAEEIYVNPEKWVLHSFNKNTKAEGYHTLNLKSLELKELIAENKAFYPPIKAKQSEKLIWANSNFTEYPNLKISDSDFTNIQTLTDVNPQQKDINWGKISLTQWSDFNGDTLKGLLVLPEDFDPTKKYPVIIYFYEKYSDNLYRYWSPRPSHSTINFSFYASNGYIVFVPDINYGTGLPGKDAYNAIVSGTKHISNFPFVNTNKIGIQGQSWGGYQVAYLVTQSNLYACGMAGAPVSNMTSAYGGIRWESGMSRMFQYEHTQSRIGGTLWNRRDKYIENSPVFFADRVETPLLMMHNDNDGAVPWYQSIEYFVALRRLNKPVWLLNYNGDSHNLRKWPNRVDLSIRMFSFFEHYLKDKPVPLWMEKGLPAIKKGKELRY